MRKKLQEKKKQWMEWLTGLFARGKELIKTVREHMAELSREQELEERKIQALKRMIRYAGELLLVLFVFCALMQHVWIGQVQGASMRPTYQDGQFILLLRGKEYNRGDVVGVEYSAGEEKTTLLKRIIAIGGDVISVLLCIFYILRHAAVLVPERRHFAAGKHLYGELLSQGVSMGIMNAVVCSGTVILQRAINHLGAVYIACQATARKLNPFMMLPNTTMGAAIATFISQNAGAGNKERIKKGMRIACRMSICWGIIATVVLALFAKDLVALFGSKQAEILANAALYLRVASPFYVVLGILYNMRNGLQAMGEKSKPLTSSFMELVGKIVFSACIIPVLGYWGVIICEPLIWCGMTVQLVYCYVHVMRDNLQKVGMET